MAEIAEKHASSNNLCYSFGGMDAKAVARAAGVPLGTLNVWVQRGVLPGIETGKRGRRRDITAATALEIAIFAQLMRFNVSPDHASGIAAAITTRNHEGALVVVPPSPVTMPPKSAVSPEARSITFGEPLAFWQEPTARMELSASAERPARIIALVVFSYAELERVFETAADPPRNFQVIPVDVLVRCVREAEQEWQESRGAKNDGD